MLPMPKTVRIIERRNVFQQAFFKVEEATLQHERYDGKLSEPITRLNFDRGDSVAAVLHRTDTDELVLVEQFRFSTYITGPGWIRELPAGTVFDGDIPEEVIEHEIYEETGYKATTIQPITTFYVSPGGTSEQVHLYYVPVNSDDRVDEGGGVDNEGEDIKIEHFPLEQVRRMLADGDIRDAKTVIGVQWLLMRLRDER